MNMKKYKLGDLLSEFHAGKAIQTENIKNKGAYPVYGGNGQRGYTDSYNQDGEYLIIGRQGAYCGNVRYNIGKAYLTEHAIVGQTRENHNPIYIALKLSLMKLSQLQGQSAQPGLSVNTLSCISMEMPPKEIQDKIADIMLKLDRKIELNRQINDNLEAMAKQLYDYWFVQFDFPNEEGKPYKSSGGAMVWNEKFHLSIPSNWEAIPLSEIMDYAGGSQPPASEFIEEYRDGYVRFVQIRDYYSNSHITYIPIRKSNKLCAETDIMIARYGASLGRICYGLNGAYNVALAKVSPKVKEYTEYLRIFLMSDGFYNKINSIGQRAAQAGFNKDDIENILIPFPTNNRCIIEFNKKMQPYFFARLQNDKEINTLTKQRDELLPLLMNGQASVNYHLSVFYTKR